MTGPALSILDLATVGDDIQPADALKASLRLACAADGWGFTRYWFSEHHNMKSIVSSSPAILTGYIAANTERIRVGSGGVMLPNHAPLVIAEQFGTLETLYPGRIDLGLGRAPGTTQETVRALRRDLNAAEHFPSDVRELQMYFGEVQPGQRVLAVPGAGTHVPLYILGSSMFGAQMAAAFGLPYAFASHFAPTELVPAVEAYRSEFQPSDQLASPHVIAGVNVFAADSDAHAEALFNRSLIGTARAISSHVPGIDALTDTALLESPIGQQAQAMLRHTAVGQPGRVREELLAFTKYADADELIVAMNTPDVDARLRSYEILAEAFSAEMRCSTSSASAASPGSS